MLINGFVVAGAFVAVALAICVFWPRDNQHH